MRSRSQLLGVVYAPDEKSAEAAAIAEFKIGEDMRPQPTVFLALRGGCAVAVSSATCRFGIMKALACTAFGYISPERARLNGNNFPAGSLLSAAARRCADHASSAARFSSAQSCL